MLTASTLAVDPADVARFERLGEEWWNPQGPMRPLHQLNPVRLGYLRDVLVNRLPSCSIGAKQPLKGLSILDIGCGGGLLCEPLTRLGARMTGIDPGEATIAIAQAHAKKTGLEIDYRCAHSDELAAKGEKFDAVLAMEVVEHVPDVAKFMSSACSLVRPGGLLVAATLNRTLKSYALAIVGAEYVLGWLPRGTHDWKKFVTPAELSKTLNDAGLKEIERKGIVYNPLRDQWLLSYDTDVNYMLTAQN